MNTTTTSAKKTFKTITTQLLLLFLVVTFAVWGIGDIVRGSAPSQVAKVGERAISIGAFQQELSTISSDAAGNIPDEVVRSEGFRQQVLAKLVQNALVEEVATASGIVVDEHSIAADVRKEPAFQDLRGKFDAQKFTQFLDSQRISEGQFTDSIARQKRAQMLVAAYQLDQINDAVALAALEALSNAETRDITLVRLSARNLPDITPSDAELEAFYERSKDVAFMNPETRDITVLTISKGRLLSAATSKVKKDVSEAIAVSAYIQNLSDTLDDKLAGGVKLDALKDTLGVTASISHKAGLIKDKDALEESISKAVWTLEDKQASSFITLKNGDLAAVQIDTVRASAPKPFASVKPQVRELLISQLRARALSEKALTLAMALKDATDDHARRDIANKAGASVSTIAKLNRKGGAKYGITLPLMAEIFDKEKGAFIAPMPGDDEALIPIVTAIHAPAETIKPSAEDNAQALRIIQGMVSNALLNDFEKEVPINLYPLPKLGVQ